MPFDCRTTSSMSRRSQVSRPSKPPQWQRRQGSSFSRGCDRRRTRTGASWRRKLRGAFTGFNGSEEGNGVTNRIVKVPLQAGFEGDVQLSQPDLRSGRPALNVNHLQHRLCVLCGQRAAGSASFFNLPCYLDALSGVNVRMCLRQLASSPEHGSDET